MTIIHSISLFRTDIKTCDGLVLISENIFYLTVIDESLLIVINLVQITR